jgi:hypothetical protein
MRKITCTTAAQEAFQQAFRRVKKNSLPGHRHEQAAA